MCLAIPGKIESLEGGDAIVNIDGNRIHAMTALVPEVKVGDWVLVHAGLAVTAMSEADAMETLSLMRGKYGTDDE